MLEHFKLGFRWVAVPLTENSRTFWVIDHDAPLHALTNGYAVTVPFGYHQCPMTMLPAAASMSPKVHLRRMISSRHSLQYQSEAFFHFEPVR